jgi:predicted phage-related endonuclease
MRTEIICKDENDWRAIRARDVTSTETAMLYGMSPYGTSFELWHRKKDGAIVEIVENERMAWGKRLQDAIAIGICADHGVTAKPLDLVYQRIEASRMGSSFDYEIVSIDLPESGRVPGGLIEMFELWGPGLLEIKNVDGLVFKQQWVGDDKRITPPDHIEVQLQHQLHVRDRAWGAIGVLVGGNSPRIVIRERDKVVGDLMEQRIGEFWRSIAEGKAPEPVFPGDAEFVSALYGFSEPGKVYDGRGNAALAAACEAYRTAAEREKRAKEEKESAKAQALMIIGDAEKALLDGFSISAGMVAEAPVSYIRKPYRNWRVTPKKG